MIHGGGEQQVERSHRNDRDADGQRKRAARILGLAACLGDRVESDEAREQEGRRRHEGTDAKRPCLPGGYGLVPPLDDRRGKIGLIKRKPHHDHDRAKGKHEKHQRNERPLIETHPAQVDADERPQEGQRNRNADGARLQRFRNRRPAHRLGDVAQKRYQEVRNHPDGNRHSKPL